MKSITSVALVMMALLVATHSQAVRNRNGNGPIVVRNSDNRPIRIVGSNAGRNVVVRTNNRGNLLVNGQRVVPANQQRRLPAVANAVARRPLVANVVGRRPVAVVGGANTLIRQRPVAVVGRVRRPVVVRGGLGAENLVGSRVVRPVVVGGRGLGAANLVSGRVVRPVVGGAVVRPLIGGAAVVGGTRLVGGGANIIAPAVVGGGINVSI